MRCRNVKALSYDTTADPYSLQWMRRITIGKGPKRKPKRGFFLNFDLPKEA